MSATPNLGLSHLIAGQASKDVTVNQTFDGLDEAIAGHVSINVGAGGTFTLTQPQWINLELKLTGAPGAAVTILVPLTNPKMYLVDNECGQPATVKGATGTGITVATGAQQLLYCDGTNVVAAGGVGGGGGGGAITSVVGTANQIAVATAGTVVTLSLVGPYTPTTFGAHGVLLGQGTSSITVAIGTLGTVLTGAAGADPVFSGSVQLGVSGSMNGSLTLTRSSVSAGRTILQAAAAAYTDYSITFPGGAPTQGSLMYFSDGSGTLGGLADVAAGAYLRSAGVTSAPVWSTLLLPNGATQGDLMVATAANVVGSLADIAIGSYLRSGGVGAVPFWSTLTLPNSANQGDLMVATGANTIGALADVTAGSYLRSAGTGTVPVWSTLTLPNGVTTGDLLVGTSGTAVGSLVDVAVGQVLVSGGVGALPQWSTMLSGLTSLSLVGAGGGTVTVQASGTAFTNFTLTLPQGVPAQGSLYYFMNATGSLAGLADVAVGQALVSGGVGVAPAWSPTLFLSGSSLGVGETALNTGTGTATATVEVFSGSGTGVVSLVGSSVAATSIIGRIPFSTSGTANADKRIAQINVTIPVDSTTVPWGYLSFYLAQGANISEKLRIGHTTAPGTSGSNWVSLIGTGSNTLGFTSSLAGPSNDSVGERIQLAAGSGLGKVSEADYAIGVATSTMWQQGPNGVTWNFYVDAPLPVGAPQLGFRLASPYASGAVATGDILSSGRSIGSYSVANLPSYRQVILADTPGMYLRLDEASGTSFTDQTANANTGTGHGTITFNPGVATGGITHDSDGYIGLDGTTAYITVATSGTMPSGDTLTVDLLFKRTATQGTKQYLLSQGTGGLGVYLGTDNAVHVEKVGTGDMCVSTVTFTSTTIWYHLWVVKNAGTSLQIIWQQSNTGTALADVSGTVTNQTLAPPDGSLWLGSDSTAANFYSGNLDEVAVWASALTMVQVFTHHRECFCTKLGRIAYVTDGIPTNPVTSGGFGCWAYWGRFGPAANNNFNTWLGLPPFVQTNGTYTIGDLFYASATGALSRLAAVATGSVLYSQGVGVAPVWSNSPTLQSLVMNRAITYGSGTITYGTTVTPNGSSSAMQVVTVTNNTAFTIANPSPVFGGGAMWWLRIANASGGAMGGVSWGSAYKFGNNVVMPATGLSKIFAFFYDGTNHWKMYETADDL